MKTSQFTPKRAEPDYRHVYATFDTSVHNFKSTENQSSTAADALSLLEVLSMFHFTGLPMDIFREAWEGSRNVILRASSLASESSVQLSKVEYLEKAHVDRVSSVFTIPPTDWEFACLRLKKALKLLEQHALIIMRRTTGDDDAKLISMHPLVHSWAKDRLEDKSCQQNACLVASTLIALSTESSPEREPFYSKTWLDYEGHLRLHIESIVENERTNDFSQFPSSLTSKNSYRCTRILAAMGKHELLKTYLAHIFTRLKLDLDNPSCPEVLRFYKERACNLANLRELKPSLELWEKIKSTESTLPEHDTERILSLQGVARAYLANEECTKAIPILQDVQRILKSRLPDLERDWVKSSVELARAHVKAGDGASAIGCLEHIGCVNLDELDDGDPTILYSKHMLARAYLQTSETGKAIALFEEVLQLQKQTNPPYFPGILATQSWLAHTYSKAGRFENAATVLSEMVQTMKGQAPDYNKQILVAENQLNVALNSIPYGRRTSMCLVSSIKASVNIASRILFRKPLSPVEHHKTHSIALRSNNRSWTFVSLNES
ncbi:hypothetical protein BFW01_g7563 [Lasiodiplodia theobromae]|nr:hypothetical protein BFW01_g7563 [Lasiodiplodia theobromae]